MMGFGSGMMGGGFSIIFWIIIIALVYYLFRNYNRNNGSDRRYDEKEINQRIENDDAEEIARQRYAKGEISKEELREILDNLNKS